MDVDKRLDNVLGPHSPLSPAARKRIKAVMTDVLDYVKPERDKYNFKRNATISEMENNQKELGL
jgi:hypothetical protein